MANLKISELAAGTLPLSGEELVPVVQDDTTVRVPASALQGAPGADGEDGAPGAAGLSAYEVAVSEGFVGTEAEWLASLVGPEGPQGPPGSPGGAPTWDDVTDKPSTFPPSAHTHAISDVTGLQDTLDEKVDVVTGKGLSTEDYTTTEKAKLAGVASGATANSADATLLARANHTGTQAISTVTGLQTALDGKIAATEKGAANGVATLDSNQQIPESQIPAVAITDTFEVASEAAMLALTAQRGDVAIRSDENKSYILRATPASTLGNWAYLRTPTDAVLSVAGKTGAVTLVKSDVGLGNVDNTSDANKPVSTAQQSALDGKVNTVPGKGLSTEDYTSAEKTKLSGIATGATANSADATLLARANHTGTQAISTVTGLQAALDAKVGGDTTNNIGYLGIPQNSQSAAYTCVLADNGKHILHPSADTTARTFTIPANSSVPFPLGATLTFVNQNGAGVATIAITTDTMRLAGAGTTGSRSLAANGIATAVKVTATEWLISGVGLT